MLNYAQIAPLTYTGSPDGAKAKLLSVMTALPRTQIITSGGDYLYAECSTALLRFTDDVEFLFDDANKQIHVRSASRLGRKDFAANRKRVELIRSLFAAAN